MLISYAQNQEDIVLWRALKDCTPGFYVDVGANDPQEHSVTNLFYQHGWNGINIEPVEHYYKKLKIERTRDINLNLAVGEREDTLLFYEILETGLSTFVPDNILEFEKQGFKVIERTVGVLTLNQVFNQYISPSQEINFLKIDVEGFEESVIRGIDFTNWRPWVLAIEAVHAISHKSMHQRWEKLLLDNNYRYALFDGLNRFYYAGEKDFLAEKLNAPANILDDFWTANYFIEKNEHGYTKKVLEETQEQLLNEQGKSSYTKKVLEETQGELIKIKSEFQIFKRDFNWLKEHHAETERVLNTILISKSYRLISFLQKIYLRIKDKLKKINQNIISQNSKNISSRIFNTSEIIPQNAADFHYLDDAKLFQKRIKDKILISSRSKDT